MSKISNRNNKKSNKALYETMVPVAILALTMIFIVYCIVDNAKSTNINNNIKNNSNNTTIEYKNCSINISFDEILTTYDEYEVLRKNCIEYANKNNINIENIETQVDIKDETYIDSDNKSYSINSNDKMYETGPLYINNALLLRFVSDNDKMKIIASGNEYKESSNNNFNNNSNNNETNIECITVDNNNLYKLFGDTYKYESLYDKKYFTLSFDTYDKSVINLTQKEYLDRIGSIFLSIIGQSADNMDAKTKSNISVYFTEDEYNNIINSMEHVNNKNTKISFIVACKSYIDNPKCDRILLQLASNELDNKIYTTIVIKLNSDNKIFDIDIL